MAVEAGARHHPSWLDGLDRSAPVWLLAAAALVLLILLPLGWLGYVSVSGERGLTLGHYARVFTDPRLQKALWNTLVLAFWSGLAAVMIGAPMAWLIERTDFPAKTVVFATMTIGLLVPGFVTAIGWEFLLHPRIGMVNTALIALFHLSGPPISITNLWGMGWVQGLNLAPLAFIMTAAVFRSMDPALEEAAEMHGAGPWRVMRRITVRLAWPGILAASIYIFMTAFAAFDVPAIIGWAIASSLSPPIFIYCSIRRTCCRNTGSRPHSRLSRWRSRP